MEQFALEFDLTPQRRVFSVSELNAAIRVVLDAEFQDVWVSGEISGLKLAQSGHYYFTLKERESQVSASLSAPRTATGSSSRRMGWPYSPVGASMYTKRAASINC